MPRFIKPTVIILAALALIPLALAARARVSTSKSPRVHFVFDMDKQGKYRPQQRNPVFADGRAMRPDVPGTVARGELQADDHFYRGKVNGDWAKEFPMPLTMELLKRGQARFDIYCATCHGLAGDGDGPTAVRAGPDGLQTPGWVPPTSYHQEPVISRPVGHIYNTISNGIRNMPSYGAQIPPQDRWAIVAYVRALIRSRQAKIEDVPVDLRDKLR